MSLTLIIGNKNYSSWSLRPWIAMKVAGVPFEEELIPFDSSGFKHRVGVLSGTGKVPLLIDGEIRIWESLAILEYLAERFPNAAIWPKHTAARAHARAIANEMHAGFLPLRGHLPMNIARPVIARALTPEVDANVRRVETIFANCLHRSGGPFLFGAFSAADAMYVPVLSRLYTYNVPISAETNAYMRAVMALPAWKEWCDAARKETWVFAEDEVDWPKVLRA
jgi:glutathione S-transferase